MLKNRIKDCAEEAHGVRQSYNDAMERLALRTFLAHDRPFQIFWKSYFETLRWFKQNIGK